MCHATTANKASWWHAETDTPIRPNPAAPGSLGLAHVLLRACPCPPATPCIVAASGVAPAAPGRAEEEHDSGAAQNECAVAPTSVCDAHAYATPARRARGVACLWLSTDVPSRYWGYRQCPTPWSDSIRNPTMLNRCLTARLVLSQRFLLSIRDGQLGPGKKDLTIKTARLGALIGPCL